MDGLLNMAAGHGPVSVDQNAMASVDESKSVLTENGGSYEGSSYEPDFDVNDPEAVKNMQSTMVDGDANALPKYGVDSKWGEESQNAYNKYKDGQVTPVQQAMNNTEEQAATQQPQQPQETDTFAVPNYAANLGLRKQF